MYLETSKHITCIKNVQHGQNPRIMRARSRVSCTRRCHALRHVRSRVCVVCIFQNQIMLKVFRRYILPFRRHISGFRLCFAINICSIKKFIATLSCRTGETSSNWQTLFDI